MPRSARIVLPNCPHHIIQRGHNKQVIFSEGADYRYYLNSVQEWKKEIGCRIYAYCLMTNHVHLLIDSGEDERNLGLFMKRVNGMQTRYVNRLNKRSGTLWDGRYKSSPIRENNYFLACCRYIEMNPVRAGIVDDPGKYRWSSFADKMNEKSINRNWLDLDQYIKSLGATEAQRAIKYRRWILQPVPEQELKLIREAINHNQVTGDQEFVDDVELRIGRFSGQI